MSTAEPRTFEYRGVTLRSDPAREACFSVVHQHYEVYMPTPEAPVDPSGHETLHSMFNSEVLSLEIAAQNLAEFSDAPWELRMLFARQCWDETRHAEMCLERLAALGGWKGEFPIINHEWNVVCVFDSLAARLAVLNRTFEAGSLEAFGPVRAFFEQRGDERTVEVIEAILADEIEHARFGNLWVQRMVKESPRLALRIAEAMTVVRQAATALATQPGELVVGGMDLAETARHEIPVLPQERADAGFTASEIAELMRIDEAAGIGGAGSKS
jgi:bacterioferritin (cytochrome b1)